MGLIPVTVTAIVVAFGAYLAGYSIGSVNGIQNFEGFLDYFNLHLKNVTSDNSSCTHTSSLDESSQFILGIYISISNIGGAIGVLSAKPSDYFGRKTVLLLAGMFVCFGASVQAAAVNAATWMLVVGRLIAGLGYGTFFMAGPVYIAEISPPNIRGRLSSLVGPFSALGILTGYIANYGLSGIESGWRVSRLLCSFLAALYIGGMAFIPHSPRWLVLKGRLAEAKDVLNRFASKKSAHVVDDQIDQIQESISSGKKSSFINDLKSLFMWKNARIVLLGMPLQFFLITAGNVMYFYSETIFCSLGIMPFVTTIVVGSMSLLGALLSIILIDKLGRKWLLVGGSCIMILLISTAAVLVDVYDVVIEGHDIVGYTVAALISLFMLVYTSSWFVVPWVLLGEMFPLEGRGLAVGISSCMNWLTGYALTQVFPIMIAAIGSHGLLYLLAAIDLVALLFVLFFVPETKGTTLEEVQELFDKPWLERIGISRQCSKKKCSCNWVFNSPVSATNPMSSNPSPPITPEDSPQLTRSNRSRDVKELERRVSRIESV